MPPTGLPLLSTTITGTLPPELLVLLLSSLLPLLRTISRTTATTIAPTPIATFAVFEFMLPPFAGDTRARPFHCLLAARRAAGMELGGQRWRTAGDAEGDQQAAARNGRPRRLGAARLPRRADPRSPGTACREP